jgi:hypothetical protein
MARMIASARPALISAPMASLSGSWTSHCGMCRVGTATAPTNAPSSPKYDPIMNRRWSDTRWVRAAHKPRLSVTNVKIDSPWIQLKCPGRSSRIANELSTVQYIAITQTRPIKRCRRSPLLRRIMLYAPSTSDTVAPLAWSAITTLFAITLL